MKFGEFNSAAIEEDDDAWSTQGRAQFEAAYAPEDAVYEQLVNEGPSW